MKHVTGEHRYPKLMVALSLAIFSGLLMAQLAWADHETGHAESAFMAANPELSAAWRYIAVSSESAHMAANPELSAVRRYIPARSESAYMAANPELSAALRYATATSDQAAAASSQGLDVAAQRHGYYGAFLAATSD